MYVYGGSRVNEAKYIVHEWWKNSYIDFSSSHGELISSQRVREMYNIHYGIWSTNCIIQVKYMQRIYHRITYVGSVEKETLTKRVYGSGSRVLGFLAYMFFQILSVLANVIVMTTKKRFISSSLLGTSFFVECRFYPL